MIALTRIAALCALVPLLGCSNDASAGKPRGSAGGAAQAGSSSTAGKGNATSGTAGRAPGGGAGGSSAGGDSGGAGGNDEPPFTTENLLVNGDAEQGTTGWVTDAGGAIRSLEYGENEYPAASDPGPAERGTSFFDGGDNAATDSHQSVDVSAHAARIERGLRFRLGAYLGGYLAQDDRASMLVRCLAADGTQLSSATLGGPYAAERLSTTGLLAYQLDGKLPPLTATVDVHVVMTRAGGTGSDGYVDNVTLVLHD